MSCEGGGGGAGGDGGAGGEGGQGGHNGSDGGGGGGGEGGSGASTRGGGGERRPFHGDGGAYTGEGSRGEKASGGIVGSRDDGDGECVAFFGQGTSSLSLTNLSTLSASACVRLPVALPRTLGGTTALSLMAEDDSPAVLVDAGRSCTSGSANGLGGATPVPLATSAESMELWGAFT